MAKTTKRFLSLILSLLMIFSSVSVALAADSSEIEVNIVSFMRGEQTNLRSSELLEARVTGYDGNVRELTYKWTTTLGTYLYVYNSHNMYGINNTDGEVEVYCDEKLDPVGNMNGRDYADTFSGKGYAWAAVYGANLQNLSSSRNNSLVGTITVEVYDQNGNRLCSDSHEGTFSNRKLSGFEKYNLDADMDNVVIGMFVGDTKNVKDLLGESAIVHITCVESKVSNGVVVNRDNVNEEIGTSDDYIELTKNGADYFITGTAAGSSKDSKGDSKVRLVISKTNCKFHNNQTGDAVTTVFVFKKPTTETTSTTLTLVDNLDDRCQYFIDGVEGTKQTDGTIIFTGLTPNTAYTVEVRGEYMDNNGATKYAYAYVYDTTKPVYQATVYTHLDGVLTDISAIHGEDVKLYLHEHKEEHEEEGELHPDEYIELTKPEGTTGTYTATVVNGIYYPWHIEADNHEHMAREYKLIIENANSELHLHHYSVNYDTNGGAFADGSKTAKDVFSSGAKVTATENIPVRDGYVFAGWKLDESVIPAGGTVTDRITAPITLTAVWENQVNVTINVTINHKVDGGYDSNDNRDELEISFLEMAAGSDAFIETGKKLYFAKEGVTDENDNVKPYDYQADIQGEAVLETKYTATAPTYTGLLGSSIFGVALSKSGYNVGEITKVQDHDGNWTINVPLTYAPSNFDLNFSVEMEKDVPKELYPDAVIVKIACWNNNQWEIITQQRTTDKTVRPGVRVDIDPETGKGAGSYPVWKSDAEGNPYGYRAVVTGFIYDNSTIIVPTEKDHTNDDGKLIVTYTDGNYTATMGDIADGKEYGASLNGAYYNSETTAQQGTLHGVISIEKYDVTFDAMGGKVNEKDKDVAAQQYYIPAFSAYQPVMENHRFLGWYLDEECTKPATEGELLTNDITLYAKWDRILTGTVIVDGYYKDGTNQFPVSKPDRATHALIELEEITNDGTYNIAGQTVEIEWTEDEHFSVPVDYMFTGLDPDKEYRVDVYLVNYETAYQNPETPADNDGDKHNDYDSAESHTYYKAVYTDESPYKTYVNILLKFKPENYFQPVNVDTSSIGKKFRPEEASVEYYSEEVGVDDDYVLIVQHENNPIKVDIDNETGLNDKEYGENVWKKNFNGNLYDYQAGLAALDGKDLSEWPVIVTYGESARWSPLNQAPTATLQVTVIPKWFNITYAWNDGTDYKEVNPIGHIWSYETKLDESIQPIRVGYKFIGWYDQPEGGSKVDTIAADVAKDTTVYAHWEKRSDYTLIVRYIDSNTGNKLADTKILPNQTFNEPVTPDSKDVKEEFKGYTFSHSDPASLTISEDSSKNLITLYYTPNNYSYTVNYLEEGSNKVLKDATTVNDVPYGTEVTKVAPIINGYAITGDSVKTIRIDTKNNVINFYYTAKSFGYTVNYLEEGTNNVLADAKAATATFDTVVTESAIAINGYTPVGETSRTITIDTDNNIITFYYAADTIGDTDDDGNDIGDSTPDKYQKKVIFKVVNGTWSDGKAADIVKVVDLMKDGEYAADGTAALEAPTGMKENDGFKNGAWNAEIPATVSGTETLTFTYTFIRSTTPVEPLDKVGYIVEHYKADANGNYKLVEEDTEILAGKIGDTVTATAKSYDGYTLNTLVSNVSGELKAISSAEDILVLRLYYDIDTIGGGNDGDDSDNIPDKYQKKVIFKVVNGTWSDGKTADIVKVVTLMKDGKYSADGTAALEAPEGMKANEGFGKGKWLVTPPEAVSGTDTVTYTYKFERLATPAEPSAAVYIVEHYKADENGNYPTEPTESNKYTDEIGKTVTAEANSYDGYALNTLVSTVSGELKKVTSYDDILVLRLYYDIDTIGGGNDGDESDSTPDKYQKKVIFKVVNGTWSNGKTADIVQVVDLMKDGEYAVDGTAAISVPTKMKANVGYGNGSWDETPPATVSGTDTKVYTFTFTIRTDLAYKVKHIDKHHTSVVLGTETVANQTYGAEVTAESLIKTFDGYTYSNASAEKLVIGNGSNEITLYYVKNNRNYTVNYLEVDTNNVLSAAVTKSAPFDSKIISSNEVIDIENYVFLNADKDELTVSAYEDKNFINLYYAPDLTGGGTDFDEPDGIADKFQKKVVYKVVNGTWSDGTSEDIVQVVNLMKDGKYSADGTADVKVPTGMLANEGYGNGSWNVRPSLTVSGTNTETYIYTFTELPEGGNGSGDGSGEGDGSGNGSVDVEDYIVFGKTDGIGWYRVSKDGGQTWETVFGNSHYEVEWGTELTISVGDLMGDAFIFYVNGEAVQPDENGYLVITVTGYTLIGALGYKVETPDTEESLNWFQKIIKAIREFFERLFGKR